MVNRVDSNKQRLKRHKRVRAKISGTAQKPRMCVYRSLNNIYVQIIDDTAGKTLVSASSVEPAFGNEGGNKESAKKCHNHKTKINKNSPKNPINV